MGFRPALFRSLAIHLALAAALLLTTAAAPNIPQGLEVMVIGQQQSAKPSGTVKKLTIKPEQLGKDTVPEHVSAPIAGHEGATDGKSGVADGVAVAEKERYVYELRQWIDSHKQYPPVARSLRQQGRVEITFAVNPDGAIQPIGVTAHSPHPILDRAALQLIESLDRFKPFPDEMKKLGFQLTLPIEYRLL
jgi:protein TonB